ncbi:MAG TPA: twin-arginine translocation signal domain-containing protein [Polyangiaceae bacterium]|jgi:hypothetical protein|nr:twin-arginine translocation signal domain-containing protein [Polyangiaceae bacterium]
MTTRRDFLVACGASFAALAVGTRTNDANAAPVGDPLAIIVAKESALNDLTLYELKRLYSGDKTQGPDGTDLIPLNRSPAAPERIGFDRSVLGMSQEEVARYWIDRRIRGQGAAPKSVDPAAVAQRIVTKLNGSIAYVNAKEVIPQVKMVRIDGKLPGQPGYPVTFVNSAGGSSAHLDGRLWRLF